MHIKNQKGIAMILEVILIAAVVGVVGFVGLKVYEAKQAKVAPEEPKNEQVYKTEFSDKELGVSLSYPSGWGKATLADGKAFSPGKGSFKQLSFDGEKSVHINFVTGGFVSPLDGCPEPLTITKHDLGQREASIIGWEADKLKMYTWNGEVINNQAQFTVQMVDSVDPGKNQGRSWQKIRQDGNVLHFKFEAYNFKPANEKENCHSAGQAEANEANTYSNFLYYALNFKNTKVLGVNASYDIRQGEKSGVSNHIISTLKSVKELK